MHYAILFCLPLAHSPVVIFGKISCANRLKILFVPFQTTSCVENLPPEITFEKEPPPIEWHLAACNDMDMFNILTVRESQNAGQFEVTLSAFYHKLAVKCFPHASATNRRGKLHSDIFLCGTNTFRNLIKFVAARNTLNNSRKSQKPVSSLYVWMSDILVRQWEGVISIILKRTWLLIF